MVVIPRGGNYETISNRKETVLPRPNRDAFVHKFLTIAAMNQVCEFYKRLGVSGFCSPASNGPS